MTFVLNFITFSFPWLLAQNCKSRWWLWLLQAVWEPNYILLSYTCLLQLKYFVTLHYKTFKINISDLAGIEKVAEWIKRNWIVCAGKSYDCLENIVNKLMCFIAHYIHTLNSITLTCVYIFMPKFIFEIKIYKVTMYFTQTFINFLLDMIAISSRISAFLHHLLRP